MKALVYLSRSFVEFGPFSAQEMSDFRQRGLLRDIDHVRWHGEDDWLPVEVWAASLASPAAPKAKAAKAKTPKKAKDAAPKAKPKAKVAKKKPKAVD